MAARRGIAGRQGRLLGRAGRLALATLLAVAVTAAPEVAPAAAATTRYEAESATISQGVVESNHAGFSGTGFVNYDNLVGSYVEWTVNAAAAGTATLAFRHANGSTANRPMDITVNGALAADELAFPPTGAWTTWQTATATVTLNAGTNTIRATASTAAGGPNVDFLEVAEAPPPSQDHQAEDATISQGVVESNWPGFTGTGFVNYDNVAGSYVEFTVDSPGAETTTLTFRYANGSSATRPMDVAVNGTVVAPGLAFAPTGAWSSWRTQTVTAALAAGTNRIRATATTSNGGPNLDSLTVGGGGGGTDWSVAMVESTMARFTPGTIGGWSYPVGLYLYGQYLVYQRTGDPRYLTYIKSWVDRFVDSSGNISQSFNNLDSMLAGRLLNIMHREFGQSRYEIAADKIRTRLNTYPRTSDGGFWHSTSTSRQHQLWADGVFMLNPFLVEYGREFNDATYANDEATRQLVVYGSHLQQPNGILKHAYDEARAQSWADPVTGLAPEYWCRAIGWYGMATIDILEIIPPTHPRRAQLITILRNLVAGFQRYQDATTGRWFQVVDKGSRSDNWTETSCSSMYTFTTSRAVERGYVDAGYRTMASRGYQGVLAKISLGSDGRTNITDISIGTNVGDYSYYINRTRATNDFHGLGAFLIMNEQLMRTGG
jgi:unsaturated rhamnogalacturonyl hydrolase